MRRLLWWGMRSRHWSTPGVVGRGDDDAEVGRVPVGEDDEAVAPVVQPVLDLGSRGATSLGAPSGSSAGRTRTSVLSVGLVRHDDVATAAGELDVEVEPLVRLLDHEDVVALRGAQLVPPDLVRPHRVVGHDVEEVALVGSTRPCRSRSARAGRGGPRRSPRSRMRSVNSSPPGHVGGPGQQPVAGADVERAELEEALAGRPRHVLVEEDDVGGGLARRAPAVDGVRQALDGRGSSTTTGPCGTGTLMSVSWVRALISSKIALDEVVVLRRATRPRSRSPPRGRHRVGVVRSRSQAQGSAHRAGRSLPGVSDALGDGAGSASGQGSGGAMRWPASVASLARQRGR